MSRVGGPPIMRVKGFGKETGMLDAVMLISGVAFFAIAIAYVAACDRM
jgi:hypothetical protein